MFLFTASASLSNKGVSTLIEECRYKLKCSTVANSGIIFLHESHPKMMTSLNINGSRQFIDWRAKDKPEILKVLWLKEQYAEGKAACP